MTFTMIDGLVSVIIPTFARGLVYLHSAVDSAKQQTYRPIEIIVVDDNAPSSALALEVSDYCCRAEILYSNTGGEKGANRARNIGIELSKGQYLAFLDDDDTWFQGKIARQVAALKPGVGLVYCKGLLVDGRDIPERITLYSNAKYFQKELTFKELLLRNYIGTTSQALIPRQTLAVCGNFNETLVARQDYEMWLRISMRFSVVGIDEILFTHYMHKGEQISTNYPKAYKGYLDVYHIYREHYQKYPKAKGYMMCRIAETCHHQKKHIQKGIFFIYAIISHPFSACYFFRRCYCTKSR